MRINNLHDALAYFPDVDGYWQSSDLPKTEASIRSLMPAEGVEWNTKSVELLTQLGRVQAMQGKLPEARQTLDQAHRVIAEGAGKLGPRAELRWLLEQGRVLCLSMSPAKANDLFAQAWTKAGEIGEPYFAIDAALMLSTLRPPRFQNEWLKKALALAETSADGQPNPWLAQLLFLEGWHAFDFRQFEAALDSFARALTQPMVRENEEKQFPILWSQARTLRALNRIPEALAIQETLLNKMNFNGDVSGYVYLEIAECKQYMKRQDEAKSYFELAYGKLSADGWYSDNQTDELDRMKYLFKKR